MADHGSRTSIKNRKEDLVVAFQECNHHNECYNAICPDDLTSEVWIGTIERDLDFWLNTIEEHLLGRVGESSSSRSSVRSRLSQQPLLNEEMNQTHSPRPTSDPDWIDLRRRVNQLELQGVHGYSGSPGLRPGRSPPHPPPRTSSAPIQYPDVDDGHHGARPRVFSLDPYRGEGAFTVGTSH